MTLSALRDRVSSTLVEFAWDEWAQMGVFAAPRRRSPWAADPEAHLVFALQVGRDDPRLFDEVLDWLALNGKAISVQRFRNMYASEADRQLGDAALTWAARHGRKGVRVAAPPTSAAPSPSEPLFYRLRSPSRPDESFAAHGLLKPATQPSGKSQRPDPQEPINFAFLLRHGFGVGSRAEVLRFLITADVRSPSGSRPLFTTLAIAEAAAFKKRPVQDTLNSLVDAGWVERTIRANEHLYAIDRVRWGDYLRVEIPQYRDWANVLVAVRELHRWLNDARSDGYTPYMLASEARRLMRAIEPSIRYAGLALSSRDAVGAEYWEVFVAAVEQLLGSLTSEFPW